MVTHRIPITTAADGSATKTVGKIIGRILQIHYDGGFANSANISIVTATNGQNVWVETGIANSAAVRAPRQPIHAQDGTALLYASAGEPISDFIYVDNEDLTITIASGGNAQTGTLTIITG